MDSNERKIVQELVTVLGCVIPASDGYEPRTNLWNKYTAAKNMLAAAPQVVANERELSLLYGIGRTIIGLRDGWGDKNDADEAIANIAEVKSALAAAQVQSSIAQPLQKRDPVEFSLALIAEWDEGPQDMDTWGSHASTQLMQLVHLVHEARMGRIISHCAPTAPVQAQEPYSWVLENGSYLGMERGAVNPWKGSAGAFPLYRAPVQPVAMPRVELLLAALNNIAEACNCCGDRSDLAVMAQEALDEYADAAPAAQGDKK